MKNKIICGLLAIMLCLSLSGCGDKQKEAENSNKNEIQQTETELSTSWPSTKFPQPENCEILSVKDTYDGKQITVKWNSKEDFNNYIKVLKSMGEEEIGGYEDSNQIVWNTMNIHLSYSEIEENLNNILIY